MIKFLILLKIRRAISTHNQLYRNAIKRIIPDVRNENDSETVGPKMGK
jgi:hypothetical protein